MQFKRHKYCLYVIDEPAALFKFVYSYLCRANRLSFFVEIFKSALSSGSSYVIDQSFCSEFSLIKRAAQFFVVLRKSARILRWLVFTFDEKKWLLCTQQQRLVNKNRKGSLAIARKRKTR